MAEYAPPSGFMTMKQAETALSVSKGTVQRLMREGVLPTFPDALNKKVKLVRVSDVEALREGRTQKNAAA